jgi:hypothetical protein
MSHQRIMKSKVRLVIGKLSSGEGLGVNCGKGFSIGVDMFWSANG